MSLKVGDISKRSGTNVCVDDGDFSIDLTQAGFEVVTAMTEERVLRALASREARTTRPDRTLYIKLSLHATQRDVVALAQLNFTHMVNQSRSHDNKRTKDSSPLAVQLFAFAAKLTQTVVRRATTARVQASACTVDENLASRPKILDGEADRD